MSLTSVHQSRIKAVRSQTAAKVAAEWARLPDLDDSRRAPFAAKVAPIVAQGQLQAARLTSGYVAKVARIKPMAMNPADVVGPASRRGVDLLEEYERPFGAAMKSFGNGGTFAQAKAAGLAYVKDLSAMDVFLAARTASTIIDLATPRIVGWVREADATACDLCTAADGMDMAAAADMAGHPGCGCSSRPLTSESEPIGAADPEAIDVHEHDELGPVLYAAGQHFAHA